MSAPRRELRRRAAQLAEREQLVRVCPTHGRVLEERRNGEVLWCSARAGQHRVDEWIVVDRARLRALSRASASERAEVREMEVTVQTKETKPRAVRRLEVAKFSSGKTVLWMRLMDTGREGTTRFRVRWEQRTGDGKGKGKTATGVVCAEPEEAAARKKWDAQIRTAKNAGWIDAPVAVSRALVLRPAPAPPAAAQAQR